MGRRRPRAEQEPALSLSALARWGRGGDRTVGVRACYDARSPKSRTKRARWRSGREEGAHVAAAAANTLTLPHPYTDRRVRAWSNPSPYTPGHNVKVGPK